MLALEDAGAQFGEALAAHDPSPLHSTPITILGILGVDSFSILFNHRSFQKLAVFPGFLAVF